MRLADLDLQDSLAEGPVAVATVTGTIVRGEAAEAQSTGSA